MRGIISMLEHHTDGFEAPSAIDLAEDIISKGADVFIASPSAETVVQPQDIILPINVNEEVVMSEEAKLVAIGNAINGAQRVIDNSVPPVKRGQSITFLDSENHLQVLEAKVVAFCKLPIPNDYVVVLLRVKNRFYVAVHKNDWLRMGENIRQVENDAMDTVTSYLEKKKAAYLTVASCGYGGTKGLSIGYAANRLWKPITGRTIAARELIV